MTTFYNSIRNFIFCFLVVAGFHPEMARAQTTLANGVDPSNLGKGDWFYQVSAVESRFGVTNTQPLINYEASIGTRWLGINSSGGTNLFAQFSSNLVLQAHAAGLKIFGDVFLYGYNTNELAGEINVALKCLSLGADGLIIDTGNIFETNVNCATYAAMFCQAIRAAYPSNFLAFQASPYITVHTNFPYQVFGYYCDAVMPQAFWLEDNMSPSAMVSAIHNSWTTWQAGLTGTNVNAIKPLVPIATTLVISSNLYGTGAQISEYLSALKGDRTAPTLGGYGGTCFQYCDTRNADMEAAVVAGTIGGPLAPQFQKLRVSTNGIIQMNLNGRLGASYEVDASADLRGWTNVASFLNTNGTVQFIDPGATTNRVGYYRVKWLGN